MGHVGYININKRMYGHNGIFSGSSGSMVLHVNLNFIKAWIQILDSECSIKLSLNSYIWVNGPYARKVMGYVMTMTGVMASSR